MYRKIKELRTAFTFKKMTMKVNEIQISVSYTKLHWNTADFTPLHTQLRTVTTKEKSHNRDHMAHKV